MTIFSGAFIILSIATAAGIGQEQLAEIDRYFDPFDPNPRFIVKNGHLMVMTGRNKDLIFRSSGTGRVKINGDDIAALKGSIASSPDLLTGMVVRPDSSSASVSAGNQLAIIEAKMASLNVTLQQLKQRSANPFSLGRLRTLARRVTRLERLLNKNECEPINPCKNGGQCEDGFNRYFCRCTSGFTGTNCDEDVNECEHYQGTELGCQNGGTCLNTFGAFHCICPANYKGVRCTVEFNDCRNASSHEICGNGECFDLPRTSSGVARYRCVCYQGFTKSIANSEAAPCDADVDECATGVHRCSRSPPVACINTRAGYQCASCPAGFTGDGYSCTLTDLCNVNNGGCSLSPRVSCFSNLGRVICGPCPPGFLGDGTICTQLDGDICSSNNGGCSPQARCVANSAISATYRDCRCPPGTTGTGIGANGCTQVTRDSSSMSCNSNPCQNGGTCIPYGGGLYCSCPSTFSGVFCENPVNACSSNPCQNNGVCSDSQNGFSCFCTNEFTGPTCSQPRQMCGGVLDAASGTLSYPIANGTAYSANLTCSWVIKNSNGEGKVLNITFTRFSVEFSARCAFDFVELINGPSRDYKSFGRFCGQELPKKTGNFISSFNAVMLRFFSDHSVGHDGFSLHWSTIAPKCGGLYDISNSSSYGVMIESPGFPHHYPSLLDCFWDFVAPFGQRIQFVFTHLDIEASPNCTYDYLEIKESSGSFSTRNSHTIERFCNWTSSSEHLVPPPITTSGSFAQVAFHTDHGVSGKGFQMLFHTVPGICGGLLTGNSGTFNPPLTTTVGGSLVYESGVSCEWLIRVLPNERVLLRFLRFSLEQDTTIMTNRNGVWRQSNRTCMYDFVEVFDGGDASAPLMTRLCGSVKPPEMISSGRYMRVRFRSDVSVARQGFTAQYIALCGGEYDALNTVKTLESPNHPEPVMSKNCSYLIRAPYGHIIKLEIFEMDIEFDHRCLFDYILVHETGQKYCGKVLPPPLYSLGNELRFTFVNDETKPSKGFKARYQSIEIGCGGVLKQGQPMVAITPEHIKENPFVQQCFWELQANNSFIVVVKFLHTEASTETRSVQRNLLPCAQRSAYILVNDTDGTLIKRFCSDQLPPAISSTGTKLFITYVFRAPSVQVPTTTSTQRPRQRLTTNTITTTTNSSSSSSRPSANATIVEQLAFDLNNIEPMIVAVPETINRNAFYANYFFKKARKYCNRNVFANSGIVRSPAFPRRYPNNVNCTTVIHVDNGLQIKLNFTYFQIEPASDVNGQCFDYLELRNGRNADSPLIAKMCGNRPLPDIVSHSNYLFMRFISDSSMQRGGFSATYSAVEEGCGGLLTADSGSIESPDYPLSYSSNLNCEYKIIISQGSAIQLYIVALSLEIPSNGQCLFDYIQIWDGETDGAKSFGRFCSMTNNANGVITSTSNKMLIRFTSDATVNQGGFKLNYRTLCNRTLAGSHGVIESPNYPHSHPHLLNCNWHLLAPLGNNLTIIFTALSLEAGYNCMFDHINVSQVDRWHRPLMLEQADQISNAANSEFNVSTVKVLCGNLTTNLPAPILLSSNEAIISFVSDESRSIQSGFRLEFGSVGCGGRFNERPSGNLSSPGYPNPYPRDVECLWHIKAPIGRRIDLVINDLDMEYSKTCSFDFVQVLGGPDEKSPELARLCNQISDRKVSSIGNYMTIRMMSDSSSTRKGFTASFTTENEGCGGKFTTASGSITSPNYGRGNTYDPSSDCSFSLDNEGHFIYEITINDIDIPSQDPNCSSYLAVYDSSSEEEGRLLTKICNSNRAEQPTSVFNSTSSVVFIRFKGDGVNAGHGFNITYRTVCGKVLQISDQEDFQVVSSPNFPHVSSMDDHCHFILKAKNPRDTVTVRLTHLQSFNIPTTYHPRASNECAISYLEFYDGTERVPLRRLHHFCSESIPPPIISSGDSLLLVSFFTVFRALVSSAKSFCGGDFQVVEGCITNPGYPNSYTSLIECIWVLKASPGSRYELEFDDFDLEESDFCNGDYVELRQGNSSGPLIGDRRLCGSGKDNLPSLASSFSGDVWIKFRTDEANVAKGFLLHFKLASNVLLSGERGQIASPGYPNAFHFFNRTFTYQIMVPSSSQYVKLHFDEMQLNGDDVSSNLCSIKLSLYNGLVNFDEVDPGALSSHVMSSSHMVAMPSPKVSYCSSRVPPPFVSDNNAVTVVYTAAFFYHLPSKFLITWSAINGAQLAAFDEHVDGVPTDVNSTFNFFVAKGQSVNLVDSNYSQYGSDINWYLTTHNSMHFNLSSSLISFLPSTSCWINKITISTWGTTDWRTWKVLCNGFAKQVELPGANMIRIHLQFSQIIDSYIYPRFNLTIFPVCGGNWTDSSGVITAEDAKDGFSREDRLQCSWLVKARPGRTLQLTLEFYSIGYASSRCSYSQSYLEIRNGHSDESPLLVERLCGSNTTSFVLPETSSNVAHLTYKSTSELNNFGLRYREIGIECGGELVLHSLTDTVSVTSPGYPDSPEHGDLICDFIIRGPITSGLLLSFSYESYSPCDKNNSFLEVYSGGTELSSLIDRFCMPTHRQDSVVISSHITLLRYVLRNRDFRSKFNATIRPDNCNREFFVSGSATKLQLPFAGKALVGSNFQCSLHLRTHPSYYIVTNISSINLQGNNCSSGDVIEFRDSPSAKYSFERRCAPYNNSNNMIPTLNSFQNELFILFQRKDYRSNATDNSELKKKSVGITFSVEAKYRKCGQTIYGSLLPRGNIRSPGYPNRISRRLYCPYKLFGEPGTVFKLSFVRFNLGRTPPNVNISINRCQKRLQLIGNLFMKRSLGQTYGCSNEIPPDFTSLSNIMELYFFASELLPREGFNIRYEQVLSNESCSGLLDNPRGQVISANFNNLNYTGLIGCAWEVNVDSNQSATLVIDTFDVAGDCSNASIDTITVTGDPQYQFSSFNCITKEIAPQTTKMKYIMPIYTRSSANPIILLSFNRTEAGISRGLRGEYFIAKNCGGFFTDLEGEFTSPNYPNDLGTDIFCNWYFRLSEGATEASNFNGYRLIFTEFDIGENCYQDYFFILKPQFEQHSREKFCQRDGLPKPIYVGHDLLLSFVSSRNLSLSGSSTSGSSSGSPKKFKFRLELAQHGCGGVVLVGMSASAKNYIQSPNYANASDTFSPSRQYSSNIECVWEIRSLPDFHLEFNFNSRFDLEESANCTNDFLLFEEKQFVFVDGREVESWKVLKRLCGHKTPSQIISSTNLVRVTFRTNEKVVGDGFRVDLKQNCGGLFQEEKGLITSPRYSEGAYSNGLSCLYRIERASNEYISVTFEDIDLEYHSNCIFDKVFIYSGDHQNKSTPRSGPFCGNTIPPTVSALGLLEVQFKSDYYFSKRGFKFRYGVTSCGGNISTSSGTIVGPDISLDFRNQICLWQITVPEKKNSVAVRITELDLASENCRFECCTDLRIYDGAFLGYAYDQLGNLCANDHQELTFKSSSNAMSIVFRQGVLGGNKAASFKLVYWSTPGPKSGCGGGVIAKRDIGVITSPDTDDDSNYDPNLSCLWALKGSSDKSILQLEFERFDVEAGTNGTCDNDWLDVFDGTTMYAPLLTRLCGSLMPEKIQSSGKSLLLHFVTNDNNVTGHGFRLRYSSLNQTCGGFLYAAEKKTEITSPDYPNSYSVPQQCTWWLGNSAYYEKLMVMIFQDLDLNCSRGDYVRLVENRNDRIISKAITLCTSSSPVKIITSGQMSLTFRSDTTSRMGLTYDNQQFANSLADGKLKSQYRGFRMSFYSNLCNDTLDGMDNGYAYNYYYPKADYVRRTSTCAIRIVVPKDHQIALYFSAFSFYYCHYSNFTVYESNSTLAKAIFCNMKNAPSPVFSTSNNLTLLIRSSYMEPPELDYSKPASSTLNRILYSFNYLSSPRLTGPPGCGGNLTGNGVFSSPLYPTPLTEDRVCTWRLNTNGYHTLTLKFTFFQLSPSCTQNYLVIYEGDEDIEDKKLATFCNSDTPAPIRSQSNKMLVKLYTTASNFDVGFLASYSVNTYEPKIRGRVISSETFKYYKHQNTFFHL